MAQGPFPRTFWRKRFRKLAVYAQIDVDRHHRQRDGLSTGPVVTAAIGRQA